MSTLLAIIPGIGPPELLVVGFIALLLFGKKLPEVARSLGKGVTEFKKGVQGIQDEIDDSTNRHELPYSADVQPPQAPKFEPPPEAPAVSESVARNEPGTD
jgi:sec-independent protein translocase protein TatA